jgi:hypothetical protein
MLRVATSGETRPRGAHSAATLTDPSLDAEVFVLGRLHGVSFVDLVFPTLRGKTRLLRTTRIASFPVAVHPFSTGAFVP